jgi:hypothetical protein
MEPLRHLRLVQIDDSGLTLNNPELSVRQGAYLQLPLSMEKAVISKTSHSALELCIPLTPEQYSSISTWLKLKPE